MPLEEGGGSIVPDDQTIGQKPATMGFNRLSKKKDETAIIPNISVGSSRHLTSPWICY